MKTTKPLEPLADAPALRLSGFGFTYAGAAEPTIGPLDWRLEPGSFTLLTGNTGCGKTTLLRSCKPELAPAGTTTGAIELFGHDVRSLSVADSAQLVGYVSQSPENQAVCNEVWHELAFGLENLGVSQDVMRRRVAEVAHFFGIGEWLHRPVATLSGGQKQLLNLASVLVLQPRILLLDEPTAQLDPVAERNFLHALFRANREAGITVVVATHSPEVMASYATGRMHLARHLHKVPLDWSAGLAGATPQEPFGSKELAKLSGKATVETHDVSFAYERTTFPVLHGCNLAVHEGVIHAIVGGNASGKSTLLKLVAGVLEPQHGTVRNALARSQALVPQDPKALFVCDSVAEELAEWALPESAEEQASLARYLGLDQLLHLHPYDLSGGQQQLLALGKVLLAHPALLLLDEPTKGLDPQAKSTAAHLLQEAADHGVTIVMSTHDLSFCACLASFVTMLFDGQDACTQPSAWFFRENLFYRPVEDEFFCAWAPKDARR